MTIRDMRPDEEKDLRELLDSADPWRISPYPIRRVGSLLMMQIIIVRVNVLDPLSGYGVQVGLLGGPAEWLRTATQLSLISEAGDVLTTRAQTPGIDYKFGLSPWCVGRYYLLRPSDPVVGSS